MKSKPKICLNFKGQWKTQFRSVRRLERNEHRLEVPPGCEFAVSSRLVELVVFREKRSGPGFESDLVLNKAF